VNTHIRINSRGIIEIVITFRNGDAGDYDWPFAYNAGHPSYAGLAAHALREQFSDHMQSVRKAAYEQGYKDARAKRKKQTVFEGCW